MGAQDAPPFGGRELLNRLLHLTLEDSALGNKMFTYL